MTFSKQLRYYIRVKQDLNPLLDYLMRTYKWVYDLSKYLSIWTCYDPVQTHTVYSIGVSYKQCKRYTEHYV